MFSLINAFTPGPGNILALNTMTNYGWKKGEKLFWGIFAGYYCVQALCAFFVFGLDQFIKDEGTVVLSSSFFYKTIPPSPRLV
jgi:cysteine/O-acetylserine efflux protein